MSKKIIGEPVVQEADDPEMEIPVQCGEFGVAPGDCRLDVAMAGDHRIRRLSEGGAAGAGHARQGGHFDQFAHVGHLGRETVMEFPHDPAATRLLGDEPEAGEADQELADRDGAGIAVARQFGFGEGVPGPPVAKEHALHEDALDLLLRTVGFRLGVIIRAFGAAHDAQAGRPALQDAAPDHGFDGGAHGGAAHPELAGKHALRPECA